ncbi:MAG: hypothetical protein J7545_01095 [Roseofilum sp. SBFL]|uniref:hypothetical protein n=1 Tax=unclassified Roseofilum TaxID=2620099 RepID=UPI001B1DE69C|nr:MULTISPECIES: hypothetical protein [unclassified Roseofilum]MBP0014532.1 hypothetical protein [Roseofilum sp. SID3]MBP0024397.1 hypothetical protein [Roseofilum sp. SID2]MBP0037769.1 hypothetical protein [Roseofilum sp. SID1]MBP0040563.1 hypothetical protein [Roseofilum sp. SBFL]
MSDNYTKQAWSLVNEYFHSNAIEIVKNNYLNGFDKCGRDRSEEKLQTNTLANYHSTYGAYFQKLNPKLKLTGENLISEIMRNWEELHRKKTKGFKNAYTACCKLFRDTRLSSELDKVTNHFGTIKVVTKTEEQTIDLEAFLDFRDRVLGLSGYELTPAQWRNIESRRSWFKVFCINLLYGFRASEFKAILNLDEPITVNGCTFKAIHDPTNDENIIVIGDGFWVTDTSGKRHYITVKTADRIARPMVHPDYSNLIELLGIKDPGVKLRECVPKANSTFETIKRCHEVRRKMPD